MTTMVEQNLSWCTLFDLQMCLIKSKETNAEFEKQIVQLKASKENISQRLQELRSSSSQETIEQLLEDREVIALSQERDDNLSKQQVLTRDLQSVKTLLNKFKLDIDRSNKSIQRVEELCAETKASIIVTSAERNDALKVIESVRSRVEEQRSVIAQFSSDLSKERAIGERLKKRETKLKAVQSQLLRHQRHQEEAITQLQKNVEDVRQKTREVNIIFKKRLSSLRTKTTEVNHLSVRLMNLKRIIKSKNVD